MAWPIRLVPKIMKIRLGQLGPGLTALDLSHNLHFTDHGVAALAARSPALTDVDLSHTRATSAGIEALADGCPLLASVALRGCPTTDAGAIPILIVQAHFPPFLAHFPPFLLRFSGLCVHIPQGAWHIYCHLLLHLAFESN